VVELFLLPSYGRLELANWNLLMTIRLQKNWPMVRGICALFKHSGGGPRIDSADIDWQLSEGLQCNTLLTRIHASWRAAKSLQKCSPALRGRQQLGHLTLYVEHVRISSLIHTRKVPRKLVAKFAFCNWPLQRVGLLSVQIVRHFCAQYFFYLKKWD